MRVIVARSNFFYQRLKTQRTASRAYCRSWIRAALPLRLGGCLYSSIRSTERAERSSLNDSQGLGVRAILPDLKKNPRRFNDILFYFGIPDNVGIFYALSSAN